MAVGARDIPITREQAHEWLSSYDGPLTGLREYLWEKVNSLNLPDTEVDTSGRSDIPGDSVSVVDLIMADLGSYV